MYCTQCGTSAKNKRFCTKCGVELKKSAPQAGTAESILNKQTLKEVLQDQPVDLSVRQTIEHRYILESRIGGGGMGDVYHAKRSHIGDVEQSSEVSSIEAPRTTRKGNALVLLTVSSILLLTVAAGYRNLRFTDNDKNIQQSTAPVVIENVEPAPAPQLETDLPTNPTPATNPTPDAHVEKPTPNIETKPSLPTSNQPVRKQAGEARKSVGATRKAAPPKAVIPDIDDYRLNRDRRMMFDDYGRYRRYRYNSYWPDYRDRFYMRRRFRWNYR